MIAKDQNIALLTVGNSALKNTDWADYANYCFEREKGLRKEAFKHLDKFLKSTEDWTIHRKIEFVQFLLPFFETIKDGIDGKWFSPRLIGGVIDFQITVNVFDHGSYFHQRIFTIGIGFARFHHDTQ